MEVLNPGATPMLPSKLFEGRYGVAFTLYQGIALL